MFGIGRGIVYDGWNRPDDDSEVLTQEEMDRREREEALNEEDECFHPLSRMDDGICLDCGKDFN